MSTINLVKNQFPYKFSSYLPLSFTELYNLAIESNDCISNSLTYVHSVIADDCKDTIKKLLNYQQAEKLELVRLLHHEINNCCTVFYGHNDYSMFIYPDEQASRNTEIFVTKSLDNFIERVNNFNYVCRCQARLTNTDLLIIFLGLRDYCANFFQQMSLNYSSKELTNLCSDIVCLIDCTSDKIGDDFASCDND